MRILKQLMETKTTGLVGLFENGDRVQELFQIKADKTKGSDEVRGFEIYDPDKSAWVEFKLFQRSGP